MLNNILASTDGWSALQIVAMLVPALVLIWTIMTVMGLHKRDVYFWSLGSTWISVIACPIALVIMSQKFVTSFYRSQIKETPDSKAVILPEVAVTLGDLDQIRMVSLRDLTLSNPRL